MKAAIDAVKSQNSGVNRAAIDHGVPPTTLKDRLSGRVQENTNPGPSRYLDKQQEKELSTFVKDCAAIGYGKTRREVMRIAESYAKQNGLLRKDKITQGWWRNFVSRQGDLSLRKGDNTAHVRMDAINSETLNHYFNLLETTLKDNGLMHSPSQIYNVDESGMPLDPKAPNIVAETGTKKVRYRSTGRKGQITIVACGSAAGQIIPPTVIYEAKKVNHAWTSGEVPGTKYGCSDKGWITTDLFESWLSDHFLPNAVCARPLLLLLDGHSTHNQPEVIRFARKEGILILCLPPHATHEAQPLDCAVFSPLKAQWRKVAHDFLQSNPGQIITKFNFNGLFAKAWGAALTPANLIAGFRTCGIYPYNRSAITVPGSKEDEPTSTKEGNAGDNTESSATTSEGVTEDNATRGPVVTPKPFTAEQEVLFKRRFEEGYDVYIDKDYIRWINLNHPELRIEGSTDATLDNHTNTDIIDPCEEPTRSHSVVLNETAPGGAVTVNTPVSVLAGPSTSPLSDLLVCPALSTSIVPKRPSTRARLLTSDESLQLLEEKEKKKEMEALEKEKRKSERAAKKKEREELLQKKKEEKAKQAEERARKAEEKAAKTKTSKRQTTKKKSSTCPATSEPCPATSEPCPATSEPCPSETTAGPLTDSSGNDEIDVNICCMCFGHYEDDVLEGAGVDWIFCKCGRWLHEDCVDEVVKNNDGEERFCSFCVDKFTI